MKPYLILVPIVTHVHIEIGDIRQYHGVSGIGNGVRHHIATAHSAPCVDPGNAFAHGLVISIIVSKGNLLPALDADAARIKNVGDAAHVILTHLMGRLHALALHQRLHCGSLVP